MSAHVTLLPKTDTVDGRKVLEYIEKRRGELLDELQDATKDIAATQAVRGALQELKLIEQGISRQ